MSIAEAIAPHLPYLRRYARSLTGSQQSGDNYVAAVLEALIANSDGFDRSIAPRVALYRHVHEGVEFGRRQSRLGRAEATG